MTTTPKVLLTAASAAVITLASQALPVAGAPQIPSASTADSVAALAADTTATVDPLEQASELYRAIKFAQTEGEPGEDYYQTVIDCNTAATTAIKSLAKGTPEYDRCKSILRDINQSLEAGAYFYSSANNSDQLARFAGAYIDTHLLDAFHGENFRTDANYPSIIYIAASGAYNSRDFAKAIDYFRAYFATGEPSRREQVYMYMGQACLNIEQYDLAVATMLEAVKAYPENYHLISFGIKVCIDGSHSEHLQPLLDKALALKPDDEQLLNIQGKLLEDNQEYLKALSVYNRLDELKPMNLSTARHIALCYYNLGVDYFNRAITSDDERTAKKLKRQSNDYFSAATGKLEEVIANDPTSVKYLKALAVSYGCMDNRDKFEEVNTRIQALGESPMPSMGMPPIMAYNENNTKNYGRSDGAVSTAASTDNDTPRYSDFAKSIVEERLAKWTRKGEFERPEDYQRRVNDATIRAEYTNACREAEKEYLEKYARRLRLTDLELKPYDAANEVYLVESSYGPMYVNVPLANNEAELFKSNWAGIHFRNPKYTIVNDEVRVASLTFVTPTGKSYVYNNDEALAYANTNVDVDFEAILRNANSGNAVAAATTTTKSLKVTRKSDVDENIPTTSHRNPNALALVIANENYAGVPHVESALHDGETMAKYLEQTLGLPKENIIVQTDATLGALLRAIAQTKNAVKSMGAGTDLIVYYAGHGMPNEATKDALLLPVDGDPLTAESCYSLNRLYDELGNSGAENIIVFLDACFSGSNRGDGMLTATRGVAIKPKEVAPQGNMFILSATSGQETALPYAEKNHGLFTYYLLKKLQQTRGNVTLSDLAEDVKSNVARQSNLINRKPQTPQVSLSGNMRQIYSKKKLTAN